MSNDYHPTDAEIDAAMDRLHIEQNGMHAAMSGQDLDLRYSQTFKESDPIGYSEWAGSIERILIAANKAREYVGLFSEPKAS